MQVKHLYFFIKIDILKSAIEYVESIEIGFLHYKYRIFWIIAGEMQKRIFLNYYVYKIFLAEECLSITVRQYYCFTLYVTSNQLCKEW